MLRTQLSFLALMVASALASADLVEDIRHSFHGAGGFILPRQNTQNLQTFTGALGGAKADAITNSGNSQRPFEVGGDTFPDFATAAGRACDNQKNACSQIANNGTGNFEVSACDTQSTACKSAITTTTQTAFNSLVSSNAEFDFFCDN